MAYKKIIFFKSIAFTPMSTEEFAIEVLNDPKYDDFHQYIDKSVIEDAFDEYGYKLNPFNSEIYTGTVMNSPNVEGHFLSQNLPPQIESIVVNKFSSKKVILKYLDTIDDITHIAFSVYAAEMHESIKNLKLISKNYPDKELYLGGIGVNFPHITELIKEGIVKKENICYGNGVNWLRNKLGFKPLSRTDFKIPSMKTRLYGLTQELNSEYLVTQIGCPFKCDFCITNAFLQYNPFCTDSKKIINHFEGIRNSSNEDVFLFLCDPNAFFPERVWKQVFDHFSLNEIKKQSDNKLYIIALSSLVHLNNFNIEKIQEKSCLKFFIINFGMESTLAGGYKKNLGINNNIMRRLSQNGILLLQNFIIGLPIHNEKNIEVEIKRNCEYDAALFEVNTLKPLAGTILYENFRNNSQLFERDLPPEFLYQDGFLPFNHSNLGGGFSILKHAFKAYYECEKKIVNVYKNLADIIAISNSLDHSSVLEDMERALRINANENASLFKFRMPEIELRDSL